VISSPPQPPASLNLAPLWPGVDKRSEIDVLALPAFYRTLHGAEVDDLLMRIIHTCSLNRVNSCELWLP